METRQITQVHIFFILLNPVYGRYEDREVAACALNAQDLVSFYNNNLLQPNERYRDEVGKYRSFIKGPLFDYNPNESYDEMSVREVWVPIDDLNSLRAKYYFIQ